MALVASSLHRFLIGEIDCVGGLRNATIRCGCICVASDSSGALGPFTPVDPTAKLPLEVSVSSIIVSSLLLALFFNVYNY